MIEHIRQSNLIENISDPAETEQSLVAWQELEQIDLGDLSHVAIKGIHRIIVANQTNLAKNQIGRYRDLSRVNVRVGLRVAPKAWRVPGLMSEWIENIQHTDPLASHVEFEKIHPFADGNGRVGRMLLWWHEKHLGEEPTLFKADERQKYYQLFRDEKSELDLNVRLAIMLTNPELYKELYG